jgi:hypothetical protein
MKVIVAWVNIGRHDTFLGIGSKYINVENYPVTKDYLINKLYPEIKNKMKQKDNHVNDVIIISITPLNENIAQARYHQNSVKQRRKKEFNIPHSEAETNLILEGNLLDATDI